MQVMHLPPRAAGAAHRGVSGGASRAQQGHRRSIGTPGQCARRALPPRPAASATPAQPPRDASDTNALHTRLHAAIAAEVGHFVLVSSRGVTNVHHGLNSSFGNVLIWKLLGEHYLRASGLSYTVVRPGGLTDDTPRQHAIYFEQGDPLASNSVSRGDVAMILVAVLRNAQARGRTFEINRTAGTPPADWATLFADLAQD
jgi:uncharacterized protein YbjT (DUF2867 family)